MKPLHFFFLIFFLLHLRCLYSLSQSQDIGRLLLNIINNSFQACAEQSRSACATPRSPVGGEKFTATVSVRTTVDKSPSGDSRLPDGQVGVKIFIKDNGPGIPDAIKDKIFQPFFTIKPTGEGTGLGLSLIYDIVKAHGGEIRVEANYNKGTTFNLQLVG